MIQVWGWVSHGMVQGMERVWNGYGTVYGTKWTLACKNKLPVCFSDSLARASNGMVWYGMVWYGMVWYGMGW